MRKTKIFAFLLNLFFLSNLIAQNATIEGYVFESGNRGYLSEVEVTIASQLSNRLLTTIKTDVNGYFSAAVPIGQNYLVSATKSFFDPVQTTVAVRNEDKNKKVFTKIKMNRKPGYIFEVTLAEVMMANKQEVDAITGARIEVMNNTTKRLVLNYPNHPQPTFKVNFERGNHYTVLIRKAGYFAKRMEAYVDVKGCILCFEGVGNVRPGVSEVLTEGNQMGTLLANVSMQPLRLNQPQRLQNVDFAYTFSATLTESERQELDELSRLIKSNPNLTFEISAHSDSRGDDAYNLDLSQRQADVVFQYLNRDNDLNANQLIARGYGENQLLNQCRNGVSCSDTQHLQNRRIEWQVIRQTNGDLLNRRSLAQILEIEDFNNQLSGKTDEVLRPKGQELLGEKERLTVQSYGIDTEKIVLTANPDGVDLPDALAVDDPYAQVTNATRLVDENYDNDDREWLKRETIPAAYEPTTKISDARISTTPRNNRDIPTIYGQNEDEKIQAAAAPKIGETVVATATTSARTRPISTTFTGYKIEFKTAFQELPANHEIFSRHGNIVMQQLPNGMYSYLLGNFSSDQEAATFLEEALRNRYPDARLVYFQNGRRMTQQSVKLRKTKPAFAPPR
ncbi:MAG: OmpA family protein [Bacteroidota bacterium]